MLNLGGIVLSMANETVTVARYTRDSYDSHGRLNTRANAVTAPAQMSVQPITGAELKRLPDGMDATEGCSLWSISALRTRDLVTCSRGQFEVFHVEPWDTTAGYCKALARKVHDQEGDS